MAYSEVVKNFNRIRDYMQEFYVYGFKSREEYTRKSARSYDDERRRLESWLGDYVQFRQTTDGKNVFLSIDSRSIGHNPLYKAWKAKSFTDGDITLHFLLMDVLAKAEDALGIDEIMEEMDAYFDAFQEGKLIDESTLRKKLKEYVSEGILVTEKRGKALYYRRSEDTPFHNVAILDYFSEVAPCGVIGSFLLDKEPVHKEILSFKHHYITSAMDSEVVYDLLCAIGEKREIEIETFNRKKSKSYNTSVIPLQIRCSVQSGRQHVMVYFPNEHRVQGIRVDRILSVKAGEVCEQYDEYRAALQRMLPHIWGVSTNSATGQRMEHVEFIVQYEDNEPFIHQRLLREKRYGTVEKIDEHHSKFSIDVYDSSELHPWIRTFIGRITKIEYSNKSLEKRFLEDLQWMYRAYDLEEREDI